MLTKAAQWTSINFDIHGSVNVPYFNMRFTYFSNIQYNLMCTYFIRRHCAIYCNLLFSVLFIPKLALLLMSHPWHQFSKTIDFYSRCLLISAGKTQASLMRLMRDHFCLSVPETTVNKPKPWSRQSSTTKNWSHLFIPSKTTTART